MNSIHVNWAYHTTLIKWLILIVDCTTLTGICQSQTPKVFDHQHYSNVFNEIRNYRIVLPSDYEKSNDKKYPVIYYYHGWSQRYFGSTDWGYQDPDTTNMQKIIDFVSVHDVIVVRPDGYDRNMDEEYSPRPYNIGDTAHVTHRQFPLYFPELIDHIDRNYRTFSSKEFRAIAGLSMGGFMAYWIGGKYSDKVCAVGNFCGSTEFFVGPPGLLVEYNHKHLYKNYNGVRVRLHYGSNDFIRAYHEDVNRTWIHSMPNYSYRVYETGHISAGLYDMFSFFMDCFSNPIVEPQTWNHIDIYPDFEIRGYHVSSDRDIAGFTCLNNVSKYGFAVNVRNYLPDGQLLRHVRLSITTPPIYKKNTDYIINGVDRFLWKASSKVVKTNDKGSISINLNGSDHCIGINEKGASKAIVKLVAFETSEDKIAIHGNETNIKIKLFNAGLKNACGLKVKIRPFHTEDIDILKDEISVKEIEAGSVIDVPTSFRIHVKNPNAALIRLLVTITDNQNIQWNETIDIPVIVAGTYTDDFIIADGIQVYVFTGGLKKETVVCGTGNGDGIVNPGELVVILFKDGNAYRRARIHNTNPNMDLCGMMFRKSESWEDWDNTGASNKFSELLISSDCHEGSQISCNTSYQFPIKTDVHERKYHQIKFEVKGNDKTPPWIQWFKATGDNLIRVKLADGGEIKNASVKLIPIKFYSSERTFELNDEGKYGDQIRGDMVFTAKIPKTGFNLYHYEVSATDKSGNQLKTTIHETNFLQ